MLYIDFEPQIGILPPRINDMEVIMPVYSFRCKECGEIFDFLYVRSSEKPECPKCGSKNLEKQLTAPAGIKIGNSASYQKGTTCCGRTERCDSPPCSAGGVCKRGK